MPNIIYIGKQLFFFVKSSLMSWSSPFPLFMLDNLLMTIYMADRAGMIICLRLKEVNKNYLKYIKQQS